MTAAVRVLAATVTCLLVLTGCGSSSTPAEEVPELADTLTSVEDALAQQRYVQARRDLRRLVATTEDARASGDLGEGEADRVLAAAARLLAALPAVTVQTPSEPDEPAPSPQPEDTEQAEEGGSADEAERGEEDAKKLEEERKKLEEERKKLEEERKKLEEGGDNWDSSESGPDDGHGN